MERKTMPAKSEAQRRLMAIAGHEPEKLYAENTGVLKMGKEKLKEFATKSPNALRSLKSKLRSKLKLK